MFRICLGVIPVFLAYALFATVVYGDRLEQFGELSAAAMTLFAVLVGDEVRPTFMALKSDNGVSNVISGLFLGSFVMMFIPFFMQIMIAVVEDALIRQGMWMLDHRKLMRRAKKYKDSLQDLRESADGEASLRNQGNAKRGVSGFSLGLSDSAVSLLHTTAVDGSRRV